MSKCTPLSPSLLALLVLTLQVPAAQAGDLACSGPATGHLGTETVCTALRPLLAGTTASVRLELTRDEPHRLAGRLSWQAGNGPVVEVTSSDRPLDRRAAQRLATGLIAASDLP